jgi:hypothetical protein
VEIDGVEMLTFVGSFYCVGFMNPIGVVASAGEAEQQL